MPSWSLPPGQLRLVVVADASMTLCDFGAAVPILQFADKPKPDNHERITSGLFSSTTSAVGVPGAETTPVTTKMSR